MSKIIKNLHEIPQSGKPINNSRRKFLAYSGVTLTASGLLLFGCKDDEDPMPTMINAPSNLMADNATEGQISLSWTDNANDEDSFKIERSMSMNSGFAEVGSVNANTTTYVDEDVDAATEYFYRVRASRGTEYSTYSNVVSTMTGSMTVSLGSGDVGILNYAYALEQLEAAFYTQVMDGGYFAGAPDNEKQILSDIQKHEVAHREFFKAAITAAAPDDVIPALSVNFADIDFDSRDSVLGTAKVFEDLGVSAYNGAGQFIQNGDYLLIAGKIVSVEARHAAAIRDLLNPKSADFAGDDIINANGLEITRSFSDVLTAASNFIATPIDASGLPSGSGFQVAV